MRRLFWFPLLTLAAVPVAYAQQADDLSRFSRAIGREVSIVERSGLVREGVVETVTADEVVLRVGSSTQRLPGDAIARAALMKDGRRDGAIKGAIFGAITGAWAMYSYHRHPEWINANANLPGMFLLHVTSWSALGWLLDAANTNRETFYQASAAVRKGTLQLSFRF